MTDIIELNGSISQPVKLDLTGTSSIGLDDICGTIQIEWHDGRKHVHLYDMENPYDVADLERVKHIVWGGDDPEAAVTALGFSRAEPMIAGDLPTTPVYGEPVPYLSQELRDKHQGEIQLIDYGVTEESDSKGSPQAG